MTDPLVLAVKDGSYLDVYRCIKDDGTCTEDALVKVDFPFINHLASKGCHKSVLLLLTLGAEVSYDDVLRASSEGHHRLSRILNEQCALYDPVTPKTKSSVAEDPPTSPSSQSPTDLLSMRMLRACIIGSLPDVTECVDTGADLTFTSRGLTALMFASLSGHKDIVEYLLSLPMSSLPAGWLEHRCKHGRTALSLACTGTHQHDCSIVSALIAAGADRRTLDNYNRSPADHLKCKDDSVRPSGDNSCICLSLLNDTGNESVSSQAQQPTLSDAVSKKYYSFIHWALMSKKNDFTFDREENMSQALAAALREDDVIAIPMLLHAGVDLSSPISGSSLPLCYATTARCVDLLVDAGADVDELYTDDSLPAVAYAAMSGNVEVINALLARGADVNLTNVKGWCALMMAIQFKEAGAVKALLQADPPADVNCQTIYGTTAVAFASMKNSSDILKLLIDAGADIHIADCDGYSPIMLATTTDCLKLFLKSDSNIIKNIRRSNGYTGLCALLYFWLDPEEDVDVRDEPLTDEDVASCMKLVLDHALQYYCIVPAPTVVTSGAQKRKKRASD